ncbi:hypothetical protein EUTSA_v10026644mg [Eutrema salsugineum]|uniref:Uncharacterized protein n=1 Tax=Eutrema salsugineum TaxID=72664 RepID=V4MR60_EUTSA|nr:hypothetical protein EUTSA_v10026644mg [Eutrema salsugineum]
MIVRCSLTTLVFTFIKIGVVDSRKRSREVSSVDYIEYSTAATMNTRPSKPPQVIKLSELLQNHNRKMPNVVSTGLRLSHEESFSMLPGDLTGEFKGQRNELDSFL